MVLTIQNILAILAFAIVYCSWSLLSEDKEIVRKLVFLIFLVGLFILALVYNSINHLGFQVSRLERRSAVMEKFYNSDNKLHVDDDED